MRQKLGTWTICIVAKASAGAACRDIPKVEQQDSAKLKLLVQFEGDVVVRD